MTVEVIKSPIFHDVPQNSPEWYALRVGVVTASSFDKIITPKTGKLSSQADEYANRICAEIILGQSHEHFQPSYWMERGATMEVDAKKMYEFTTGYKIDGGGFILSPCGKLGCSPDVRVYDENGEIIGAAEIKCPAPWNHVANLLRDSIDPQYIPQVQGQMLIGGFQFVDWFSYHPDMPPAVIRTVRDDEFCAKLETALEDFKIILQAKIDKLLEKGVPIHQPDKPRKKADTMSEKYIYAG